MTALSAEILQLFGQRESEAVPPWAAERLARLLGASRIRTWRVLPGGAARQVGTPPDAYALAPASDDAETGALVGDDEAMQRALGTRKPVHCEAGGGRWLIPLWSAHEPRYVIELRDLGSGADAPLGLELMKLVGPYYDLLLDAELDPLTGMANRRLFYSQLGARLARWSCSPSVRRFVAVADIDHFKKVNDSYGHLYGDEILIHFARLMRKSFRATDLLYRFGGEEFVMVFAVGGNADGFAVLERFRRAVEAYDFPRIGRITVSIGFAAVGESAPATTLVDRADQAVYYAKRSGRNRTCDYESLAAQGVLQGPAAAPGDVTLF